MNYLFNKLDLDSSWFEREGFNLPNNISSLSLSALESNVNKALEDLEKQDNEEAKEAEDTKQQLALMTAKYEHERAQRILLQVSSVFKTMSQNHENARISLSILQSFGNQTETKTITKMEQQLDVVDTDRVDMDLVPSPSKVIAKTEPQIQAFLATDLKKVIENEEERQSIELFRGFLVRLRQNSFDYQEGYEPNVENTIRNWKSGSRLSRQKDFYAWAPEKVNLETKVDHPIIHAICARLIQLLGTGERLTNEQGVKRLDKVAVSKGRQKRRVEIMSQPTRERVACLFPDQIERCTEVKSVKSGIGKAVNQCLGHLARRATFSFDFAGVGEDCENYAVAISLKEIVVVSLQLCQVGTSKVELITSRTDEIEFIGKKDSGLLLLAGALKKTILSLGSNVFLAGRDPRLTVKTADGSQAHVHSYLGSGAFSHAVAVSFQHGDGDGSLFMKIPKAAALTRPCGVK